MAIRTSARGWVADPNHTTTALTEIQYCYVNVMRRCATALINHAIPAVPVKINWARTNSLRLCCIWRLTRIRWMSMFIPPSTKCVFNNPGWRTTSSIKAGAERSQSRRKRRCRWRSCASAAAVSRKNRIAAGRNYLLYPPSQLWRARARDTALFRRRIGR